MRTSNIVSTSQSDAESTNGSPDATLSTPSTKRSPRKKGNRRATSAAGSPGHNASSAQLLVIDSEGKIQAVDADGTTEPLHAAETTELPVHSDPVVSETSEAETGANDTSASDTRATHSTELVIIPAPDTAPDTAESGTVTKAEKTDDSGSLESVSPGLGFVVGPDAQALEIVATPHDSEIEAIAEPAPEHKDDGGSEVSPAANRLETPQELQAPIGVEAAPSPTEPEAAAVALAPAAPLEPAASPLLSRRERRLAEQGLSPADIAAMNTARSSEATTGTSTQDAENTPANLADLPPRSEDAAPTDPADSSQEIAIDEDLGRSLDAMTAPKSTRSRFWLWVRGIFLFLATAAVVIGLGTVVAQPQDEVKPPNKVQLQQLKAVDNAKSIEVEASSLAALAKDAKDKSLLTSIAANSAKHSAALAPALPHPTPSNVSSTKPSGDAKALINSLNMSSKELLELALTAEAPISRLFASVGTSQLSMAGALATQEGIAPPVSQLAPHSAPAETATTCPTISPAATGVSLGAALKQAALNQQKAVYAYQVTTARSSSITTQKTRLIDAHSQQLAGLNAALQELCLPTVGESAGFSLSDSFTTDPEQALATIEAETAASYGDIIALSPAATSLEGAKDSVRHLGLTGLLFSTKTQEQLGGSLTELPGIAPAASAVSPSSTPATTAP